MDANDNALVFFTEMAARAGIVSVFLGTFVNIIKVSITKLEYGSRPSDEEKEKIQQIIVEVTSVDDSRKIDLLTRAIRNVQMRRIVDDQKMRKFEEELRKAQEEGSSDEKLRKIDQLGTDFIKDLLDTLKGNWKPNCWIIGLMIVILLISFCLSMMCNYLHAPNKIPSTPWSFYIYSFLSGLLALGYVFGFESLGEFARLRNPPNPQK